MQKEKITVITSNDFSFISNEEEATKTVVLEEIKRTDEYKALTM